MAVLAVKIAGGPIDPISFKFCVEWRVLVFRIEDHIQSIAFLEQPGIFGHKISIGNTNDLGLHILLDSEIGFCFRYRI